MIMLNNVQINVEFFNQGIPFALFWVCKTMHTPLPKNIGTVAGSLSPFTLLLEISLSSVGRSLVYERFRNQI